MTSTGSNFLLVIFQIALAITVTNGRQTAMTTRERNHDYIYTFDVKRECTCGHSLDKHDESNKNFTPCTECETCDDFRRRQVSIEAYNIWNAIEKLKVSQFDVLYVTKVIVR